VALDTPNARSTSVIFACGVCVGSSRKFTQPTGRTTPFAARHDVDTGKPGYRYDNWVLGVPHWLAIAVLSVPPIVWTTRRVLSRRRRAKRQGLCAGCGYGLRATPERCPKCGRRTPAGGQPETA
jgi:hypothetical protein